MLISLIITIRKYMAMFSPRSVLPSSQGRRYPLASLGTFVSESEHCERATHPHDVPVQRLLPTPRVSFCGTLSSLSLSFFTCLLQASSLMLPRRWQSQNRQNPQWRHQLETHLSSLNHWIHRDEMLNSVSLLHCLFTAYLSNLPLLIQM